MLSDICLFQVSRSLKKKSCAINAQKKVELMALLFFHVSGILLAYAQIDYSKYYDAFKLLFCSFPRK